MKIGGGCPRGGVRASDVWVALRRKAGREGGGGRRRIVPVYPAVLNDRIVFDDEVGDELEGQEGGREEAGGGDRKGGGGWQEGGGGRRM